jgi:SAM-dependent methyltransferase
MIAPANEISYDELPYTNYAFAQTHPDRIAALATLFGVEPPPVASCRVLELGCAAAGNLVPMAVTMPDARFVGIDLSARQIADGQAIVDALALRNVELRALSITDIEESLGSFDYIVAHGVFSWVPHDVQERLLEICSRHLAPNGVAFVSYNTLPGWHARGVIRELMRYHVEPFEDGRTKVREARAIGEFLAANLSSDAGYSAAVTAQIEALRGDDDAYIAHEHLEGCNDPVYFHQFVERAAAHRLQYLAESDFGTMLLANLRPEVAQRLAELTRSGASSTWTSCATARSGRRCWCTTRSQSIAASRRNGSARWASPDCSSRKDPPRISAAPASRRSAPRTIASCRPRTPSPVRRSSRFRRPGRAPCDSTI